MEVNEAIPSVKLNKICSAEGLTFNLCISLNYFMVLENTEAESSQCMHYRICRLTEIAVVVGCNVKFLKFLFGNDYPM